MNKLVTLYTFLGDKQIMNLRRNIHDIILNLGSIHDIKTWYQDKKWWIWHYLNLGYIHDIMKQL